MACNAANTGQIPTITSVSPSTLYAGKTYNVLVTGVFTGNSAIAGCDYIEFWFVTSSSFYSNGPGLVGGSTDSYVTVNNYFDSGAYISPTQIMISVTVAPNAPTETDDVIVTCDGCDYQAYAPIQINGCPTPKITSLLPKTWFAGESYPITITGTGFNPTAIPSCPVTPVVARAASGSSVALSNVTVVSPTQITATVTPAASDPTGVAEITVGSSSTGTVSVRTQILGTPLIQCNGTTMQCYGETISGSNATTQSAVVGQQIVLTTTTPTSTSYDGNPVSWTWTVPNTPANIGARVFGTSDNLGNPTSASATATVLTNPGLTTYWLYPNSSIPVTYKYCINIQGANPVLQCSLPANATFNVTGPTATITPSLSLSTTPPATGVWWVSGTDSGCNGYQYLVFGTLTLPSAGCGLLNPAKYGIGFLASPPPDSGRFEWVQLITSDILTGTATGQEVTPTIRNTGLDQFYPYPTIDTSWTSVADTPTISVNTPTLTTETRAFSATMYLLWTGNASDVQGRDSNYIDVPIGYVTWSISGTADNNTTATPPWSLDPTQGPTTTDFTPSTDDGTVTHGLPAWTTVAYPSTATSGNTQ